MVAHILDGKKIADSMLRSVKREVATMKRKGVIPKLVVIQVGNDPASTIYVNRKHKTCIELGMKSEVRRFPSSVSYGRILGEIRELNEDKTVHGILVQLPLPEHLNHKKVLETVAISKDVDGLHPYNHGRNLLAKSGMRPATPTGIITLLESTGAKLEGKNAVVVGRSNIVGKPVAVMLLNKGCTVTICHSKTTDLGRFTKDADIIVCAVGKPNLIKGPMVKKGAIVIDVGISRLKDGKLSGDVDFKEVSKRASWITPVPGGVGPMTIASLMCNTIAACRDIEWPQKSG
jgi:methylenetetrahydrofolate dehydrogenase (NADP+)/methenyltetrahydrofolate cyclohydrolase